MKITLYTPDGTAETFTDCEPVFDVVCSGVARLQEPLNFWGTDYQGKRRNLTTDLRFLIDVNEAYRLPAHEVTEIFETSPLVQDNIPRVQ